MRRTVQIIILTIVFFFGYSAIDNDHISNHTDLESAGLDISDVSSLSKTADCYAFSSSETQCRVPRQTSYSSSTRSITNSRRSGPTNLPRNGFIMTKSGKSMNSYTTSLFFNSINRFPSGLTETDHHLISLGKLIIQPFP